MGYSGISSSTLSQCITFGGSHSSDFTVLLTGSTVQCVDKIKYLGCYFNQDCTIDYSRGIQKFYGAPDSGFLVKKRAR